MFAFPEKYFVYRRLRPIVAALPTQLAKSFGSAKHYTFLQAKRAIAGLDGKELNGRSLKVNEARPKAAGGPPRSSGGGNRGGGGNRSGGGNRERFSNEDYRESARQPREPRW